MAGFTPGPWVMKRYDDGEIDVSTEAPNIMGSIICEGPYGWPLSAVCWEANARLISAAPDLLLACLAMLATWGGQDEDAILAARDQARAAIDKALGT